MAIEFKIELGGNFVGALQAGNKQLGETEKHAQKATKELSLFEAETGKASTSVGGLGLNLSAIAKGGSLFTFDMAEGGRAVLDVFEKIGEAVFEAGEKIIDLGREMLKVAGDAQELNVAVKLDVGDKGAEKVDQLSESFGNSAFNPEDIKAALLPILEESGNEHADQWNDLTTAATDVATRRKSGIAGAKAALTALNEIELNPQRLRGSLKELGIKQLDFYKDLGSLLGVSEKSAEAQTKAGKVKAQTLISVALNQIAAREGGALGNATNEGAKTANAAWERFKNLPERYFQKLADSPALAKVADAVDRAFQALDPSTPTGARIQGAISDVAGLFGDMLSDVTSEDGIKLITTEIRGFADDVRVGVKLVGQFAHALHEVYDIAVTLGKPLAYLSDLGDKLLGGGGGEGALSLKQQVQVEKQMLLDALQSGKISPAKFAELAGKLPAFADGGIVSGPTLALIGEDGPEAVIPLGRAFGSMPDTTAGGGGFGGASIAYSPTFQFSGSARDVEQQIEAFEQRHRIELSRFFDEVLAANGG